MGKCFRLSVSSGVWLVKATAAMVTSVKESFWPFFCQSRRNRPACRAIAGVTGRKSKLSMKASVCVFAGPKSGVDFSDVDRTTGQDVSLLDELVQRFRAAMPSIEVIKDDGRIEEDGRHQRFCFRIASSNRLSGSDRIF